MNEIVNNNANHRFELVVDGHLAATYYKMDGDRHHLHPHRSAAGTRRPRHRLDPGARARSTRSAPAGWKVIAECPFVKAWIGKHSEHRDLLKGEATRRFASAGSPA